MSRGGVRTRRWGRKHPRLVAGASAALLVGLLASLGGSVLLGAKNRELETTNTRLDEANTKLTQALSNEKTQRQRADDRTRLANERFTLALDAFKKQVFDANRLLVNRSGTQELRKAIMGQALEGLQKLVREAEKTQGAEHVRIWAHFALGDVYLEVDGKPSKARRDYQLAFDLSKRLADSDPQDAQVQRDLAFSFNKIGNVLLQQGEVQKALEHYRESLKIRQRLANPRDAEAQRDLSFSFEKIGNVLLRQGEVQKALEQHRESLKIRQRLADADPKDTLAQRDLSISLSYISDVLLERGEVQKALEQYRESLTIHQRLADANPKDARAQLDLSITFDKIGGALRQQEKVQQALEQYREGLKIVQRLADVDPRDAQAQRHLSLSFQRIGDVLLQQGEVQQAVEQYRESLKIRQRLADADPKDTLAQRHLSISLSNISDVLLQQGEVQKALEHYRESLTIHQRLAAADPHNFEAQTDLVVSHVKMGIAEMQDFGHAEAAASFEKALAVLHPWQQAGKLKGTRFALWPGDLENKLHFCQAAVKALGNLDALMKLSREQAIPLLALRARLRAKQGKHAEAASAADKLAGLAQKGEQHFLAARAFAWCARDKANEDRHAGRALVCLIKARNGGFFKDRKNVEPLKSGEAFKPLLSRTDFKKLLADLEAGR